MQYYCLSLVACKKQKTSSPFVRQSLPVCWRFHALKPTITLHTHTHLHTTRAHTGPGLWRSKTLRRRQPLHWRP